MFPGRCPGLVYDTPLGSLDDAADYTYQGSRRPPILSLNLVGEGKLCRPGSSGLRTRANGFGRQGRLHYLTRRPPRFEVEDSMNSQCATINFTGSGKLKHAAPCAVAGAALSQRVFDGAADFRVDLFRVVDRLPNLRHFITPIRDKGDGTQSGHSITHRVMHIGVLHFLKQATADPRCAHALNLQHAPIRQHIPRRNPAHDRKCQPS